MKKSIFKIGLFLCTALAFNACTKKEEVKPAVTVNNVIQKDYQVVFKYKELTDYTGFYGVINLEGEENGDQISYSLLYTYPHINEIPDADIMFPCGQSTNYFTIKNRKTAITLNNTENYVRPVPSVVSASFLLNVKYLDDLPFDKTDITLTIRVQMVKAKTVINP